MPTDKPRITFMVEDEVLEKITDYRHTNRIKNQSQAIIKLIELGLELEEAQLKNELQQPDGQADAVSHGEPLSAIEQELIELYRSFNALGQELALSTLRTFANNPAMLKDTDCAMAT